MDEDFDHCDRVLELPPEWKFPGQSLEHLLKHHFACVSAALPSVNDPRAGPADIPVYPIGLILDTKQGWRDRGLVFVYLDRDDDQHEPEYLLVKTAIVDTEGDDDGLARDLTSLRLGDEYFDQIRALYERVPVEDAS
ncbi:hypothetical protein N7492_007322 [Penicillium capsulatum]|uniref:Uncharacterized protein n=1 Tax=Penicillium capsulatum TaxID=69766 RepID=A0A9W9LL70_9EURO|nr:hypothetical protein N7492_007322 [Penicillium capsulatum]KAJ6117163.1 hypothetical protein N7512_006888 [Penicillium capsulatum]